MKKLAFVFVLFGFLISFGYMHSASADTLNSQTVSDAGWDKLTPQQQAAVLATVTSQSAGKTSEPTKVNPENFQKWVEAGTSVGKGLASIVKELGITVNEFVQTPAGKIGVGVLVWHVMGNELIHVVFGVVFLFIWIPIWISMYRNYCFPKSKVTSERTGLFQSKRTVEYHEVDDQAAGWRIALLIAFVVFAALNFWVI
jgi:hypothetical protein